MDRAHRAATRLDLLTLVRSYEWSRFSTVADVGGGSGQLIASLLARYEHMRGVLFDLPDMVRRGRVNVARAGVSDRCRFVAGDFFDCVPAGCDLYVLKAVLGGWADGDAVRILRTVRSALCDGDGARCP